MPPLKTPAVFPDQRRRLERSRTEDYLKRKICTRPERSELVRMHILEETCAEASLQVKQLMLKKARLADDLNDKLSQRPGLMELIQKNILPVHSSIRRVIIGADNSSCDEDSGDGLSPDQPVNQDSANQDSPLDSAHTPASPVQAPPPPPPLPEPTGPASQQKLTNGTSVSQKAVTGQGSKVDRGKKQRDGKPKVRKLKYHQYIPPDQKTDREAPPPLDSAYSRLLLQQQLYLQLQIISQQQHSNYPTILPAPPRGDQQTSSTSSSSTKKTPPTQTSFTNTNSSSHHMTISLPLPPLPPNLDELKVAKLKQELKIRGLTVSGTKNDLIERLKTFHQQNRASTTQPPPPHPHHTLPHQSGNTSMVVASLPLVASMQGGGAAPPPVVQPQVMSCSPSSPLSPAQPEHSGGGVSPDGHVCTGDVFGEMVSSPLTQLSLQPSSPPSVYISEGSPPACSPALLLAPPTAHSPTHLLATPTSLPADKDQMLQEKDRRIAELTRQLQQKQRQVDRLRTKLQDQQTGGGAYGPHPLITVKEEPQDITMEDLEAQQTQQHQQNNLEELTLQQNQPSLQKQTQNRRKKTPRQQPSQQQPSQQQPSQQQPSQQQLSQALNKQQPNQTLNKQQPNQTLNKQQPNQILNKQPSQQQPSQTLNKQQPSQQQPRQQPNQILNKQPSQQQSRQQPSQTLNKQPRQQPSQQPNQTANKQQRIKSTPIKLISQSAAQQPNSNIQPKQQIICKQPLKKALKPEKHGSTNHVKACMMSYSTSSNDQPFLSPVKSVNIAVQSSTDPVEEMCVCSDQLLFSPPSAKLNSTPTSRRKKKGRTQKIDDLFDILVQSGEISSNFKPAPDPTLSHLCVNSPPLPPSPSPLHLSPPTFSSPVKSLPVVPPAQKNHSTNITGRLEDFLESTTGKPILGVEPGGHVTLIDELHSQLMSTPSILDHPASPMDTYELGLMSSRTGLELAQSALDHMDWLDVGFGGSAGDGSCPLTLNGHVQSSVFSTDFLDTSDLHLHWDYS